MKIQMKSLGAALAFVMLAQPALAARCVNQDDQPELERITAQWKSFEAMKNFEAERIAAESLAEQQRAGREMPADAANSHVLAVVQRTNAELARVGQELESEYAVYFENYTRLTFVCPL